MMRTMFGPGIKTVFRTRWHALVWSAGILATAYCSVPAAQENADGGAQDQPHAAAKGERHHRNPWAN